MGEPARRLDDDNVVLTVECIERDVKVVRSVRLCEYSFEKVRFLYDKLKEFEVLFNDHTKGDFRAFVNQFVVMGPDGPKPVGLVYEVDDVGILFMTEIAEGHSAQVHFTFWDRRFKGREKLCREMLKYVFDLFKFHRIWAEVPLYAYPVLDVVERIGFVKEGRMRSAVRYKGEWFDMNLYSVLEGELNDGD